MFGVTPLPIYDPEQKSAHLADFMIFFKPGDIVKFRPIERAEYDDIIDRIGRNEYQLASAPVEFSLRDFRADSSGYPTRMLEALNGN